MLVGWFILPGDAPGGAKSGESGSLLVGDHDALFGVHADFVEDVGGPETTPADGDELLLCEDEAGNSKGRAVLVGVGLEAISDLSALGLDGSTIVLILLLLILRIVFLLRKTRNLFLVIIFVLGSSCDRSTRDRLLAGGVYYNNQYSENLKRDYKASKHTRVVITLRALTRSGHGGILCNSMDTKRGGRSEIVCGWGRRKNGAGTS